MTFKIGLAGTGFIANGVARLLINHHPDLVLSKVLTRRSIKACDGFIGKDRLTNSVDQLIDESDLIVECSGDPVHATIVVEKALQAGKQVVTMNSEFHVTTGSYFVDKGYLTEAEGDQPGCLAALHEEMVQMGFRPLVYGNMKGFMNHNPTPEEMNYWSERQGIAASQTTSFTDGTKMQIEQVLIGNAMGAGVIKQGLVGIKNDNTIEAANELARMADSFGGPIADYILSRTQPPGVFITATHDACEQGALRYYKLGDGPYYTLIRGFHLCAFEVIKTIRRTLAGGPVLLNNSKIPRLSVAAIAKRAFDKNESIDKATGGFMIRGEAIATDENPDHVPLGVLTQARIKHHIEPGQILTWDDVELVPSRAVEIAELLFKKPSLKVPDQTPPKPQLAIPA